MKLLNKIQLNETINETDLNLNNKTIYLDDNKFLFKIDNNENRSIIIYDINDSNKFELVELPSNFTNYIIELETKQIKLYSI